MNTAKVTQNPEIVRILKEAQIQLTELTKWAGLTVFERELLKRANTFFNEPSKENYESAESWLYKMADEQALPKQVVKEVFLAKSICNN